MQYKWLNRENNKKFILFFNGWGMDENAVKKLETANFDILAVNDYRNFNINFDNFNFSEYKEKYLVSWSMGVYISGLFGEILNDFDKKTAISGTTKIIDNQYGIPEKIYNYTIKFFNEESKDKFLKNIFLNEDVDFKINKTTLELKDELIAIQDLKFNSSINYDKAFIAKQDIIVPYKNQLNFWQKTDSEIIEINTPHYVFNNFKSWQDIIC